MDGFSHHTARTRDGRIHYVRGGDGPLVLLLHGWPQTWFEWRRVMPALAERHTVIAADHFAYDPDAIDTADVEQYVRAICQPGALRSGLAVYQEYFTTARQIAQHAERPLEIPAVGFGGEACLGDLTLATVQAVAPEATGGVVERSGHWMPEERPDLVIEQALALGRAGR